MKIIFNKYFPPAGFSAINLLGLIIVRKDNGKLTEKEINHEGIHTRQILECLIVFFYLLYVVEWLIRIIQYKDRMKAYYNISYEREAYMHMNDLSYLKRRKPFAFVHYFKQNKL